MLHKMSVRALIQNFFEICIHKLICSSLGVTMLAHRENFLRMNSPAELINV